MGHRGGSRTRYTNAVRHGIVDDGWLSLAAAATKGRGSLNQGIIGTFFPPPSSMRTHIPQCRTYWPMRNASTSISIIHTLRRLPQLIINSLRMIHDSLTEWSLERRSAVWHISANSILESRFHVFLQIPLRHNENVVIPLRAYGQNLVANRKTLCFTALAAVLSGGS